MKTVMIIEDDAAALRMIAEFLRIQEWEVFASADSRDAVALFRTASPDVVVVDLMMPHLDGLAVMHEIHGIDPEMPVIVMTGHATTENFTRASQHGAVECLSKTCDPDNLVEALERATGETGQRGTGNPHMVAG